jgi:hypothetical protein
MEGPPAFYEIDRDCFRHKIPAIGWGDFVSVGIFFGVAGSPVIDFPVFTEST